MKFISFSEKETFDFAKQYAGKLKGGEVIGLIGNLGAGKTAFSKGLAAGLGVKNRVTSPTFVLMKVYKASSSPKTTINSLVHIDAYRLKSAGDILAIGVEEYMHRNDVVTVIEWADRIKKILPKKAKILKLKIIGDSREINY